MRWIFAGLMVWISTAALAAVTLPDALAKRIKGDPAGYLEDVAALIAGYGRDGAIDAAGIDSFVALERAAGRAAALGRVLRADLDGDGAVTAAELAVLSAAEAAPARGKLAVLFAKADADGDGVITSGEVQLHAGAAGLAAFGDAKAQQVRAVLVFDADGDGRVTLDEVKAALVAMGMV